MHLASLLAAIQAASPHNRPGWVCGPDSQNATAARDAGEPVPSCSGPCEFIPAPPSVNGTDMGLGGCGGCVGGPCISDRDPDAGFSPSVLNSAVFLATRFGSCIFIVYRRLTLLYRRLTLLYWLRRRRHSMSLWLQANWQSSVDGSFAPFFLWPLTCSSRPWIALVRACRAIRRRARITNGAPSSIIIPLPATSTAYAVMPWPGVVRANRTCSVARRALDLDNRFGLLGLSRAAPPRCPPSPSTTRDGPT